MAIGVGVGFINEAITSGFNNSRTTSKSCEILVPIERQTKEIDPHRIQDDVVEDDLYRLDFVFDFLHAVLESIQIIMETAIAFIVRCWNFREFQFAAGMLAGLFALLACIKLVLSLV